MAAHLTLTRETWKLIPPVVVDRPYSAGQYEIHYIIRIQAAGRQPQHTAEGVPLNKNGKPIGSMAWRPTKDEDMQNFIAMIPPIKES